MSSFAIEYVIIKSSDFINAQLGLNACLLMIASKNNTKKDIFVVCFANI